MSKSNPPPVGDTLRTIPEAAAQLSLSRGYIYLLIDRGELTIVKFGRAARVRQSAIDRLIQTGATA